MTRLTRLFIATLTAAGGLPAQWALAEAPPDAGRYGYGPHMMWWDGGGYGMFFGPLFIILTLVVVIGAIVVLVQWLGAPRQWMQPPQHLPPGRTPLDILKERFARGEIDSQEFEERRRVLGD
jgi:putative membrane protein